MKHKPPQKMLIFMGNLYLLVEAKTLLQNRDITAPFQCVRKKHTSWFIILIYVCLISFAKKGATP